MAEIGSTTFCPLPTLGESREVLKRENYSCKFHMKVKHTKMKPSMIK